MKKNTTLGTQKLMFVHIMFTQQLFCFSSGVIGFSDTPEPFYYNSNTAAQHEDVSDEPHCVYLYKRNKNK
jgi:hypothetical protein